MPLLIYATNVIFPASIAIAMVARAAALVEAEHTSHHRMLAYQCAHPDTMEIAVIAFVKTVTAHARLAVAVRTPAAFHALCLVTFTKENALQHVPIHSIQTVQETSVHHAT